MTDIQFKELAELVHLNDKRLTLISDLLLARIEGEIDASPEDVPHANYQRALIEQLSALSRDSKAAHQESRKRFGLDDAA
jgi:hypothetical protein